ncbi:flagellar basal body P-ring formation chaperone FlgA [uncultured Enterovirga sp.]|uniref:flagellar basal body P-ring formation chaperone FlgA n=1 Tax=uncultured Enterovirga sp. TaxID=2026352 RepID=UPI0035C968E3
MTLRHPPQRRPALAAGLAIFAMVAATSASAADRPSLRGDVTVVGDLLTLGDLVAHAPAALAGTALFRAPSLGQSGTIQAQRVLGAAETLGLGPIDTAGRTQVTVTRAARHVGASEIEAAIRKRLAGQFGMDPSATGISFDGAGPTLVVAPTVTGEVTATDVTLDRRSRRVQATIWIGPSAGERQAQIRVTGSAVDLVEVAVAGRALARGETVRSTDVVLERRARDLVPADAILDGTPLEGRVARRAVGVGALMRPADLIRPELVARGDVVTVTYETPGVSLTMRAKVSEGGALGDTVGITNPQSKKVLQAVVIGPGRVSVSTAPTGRLAAAIPSP